MGKRVFLHLWRVLSVSVLEFVSGGQVMDWEDGRYVYKPSGGAMPEPAARNIFRDVVLGLDYLHSHRIVHRDIKPDNILTCPSGSKLADLGVAHFFEEDALYVHTSALCDTC